MDKKIASIIGERLKRYTFHHSQKIILLCGVLNSKQ